MTADAAPWTVVVPVKRLADAKTRLHRDSHQRSVLALAFVLDTVAAALDARLVRQVVVVTDDLSATPLLEALGAAVVPEPVTAIAGLTGLNRAVVGGVERAQESGSTAVAALLADLPALRPQELDRALRRALALPRCAVADAAGTGTTMLTALAGVALQPAFGPGSFRSHLLTGAIDISVNLRTLRADVDTSDDLDAAARLGLGRATRRALRARLDPQSSAAP